MFVIAFSPLHCNCAGLKVQKAQEFILYQEMEVVVVMMMVVNVKGAVKKLCFLGGFDFSDSAAHRSPPKNCCGKGKG